MHGQIAMTLNRKGRKRKSGRRKPSGDVVLVHQNMRDGAELWPGRRDLPAGYCLDERAGTVLGRLNLIWRIHNDRDAKRRPPLAPGISDQQYEAGLRYSRLVGAYLAMIGAPNGLSGQGKGYDCIGTKDCPADTCICLVRTQKYMLAFEVIEAVGRVCHFAVKRVAIEDQDCLPGQLDPLKLGLSALADHFGLTNQKKH